MLARTHILVQAPSQVIAETFPFLAETVSFLSWVPEASGQRLCLHCGNSHVDFGVRLRLRCTYGQALSYTIGRVLDKLVLAVEPVDGCDHLEEIYWA